MILKGVEYGIEITEHDIILTSEEHDLVFVDGYNDLWEEAVLEVDRYAQGKYGVKWENKADYSIVMELITKERIEDYIRDHFEEGVKFYNL